MDGRSQRKDVHIYKDELCRQEYVGGRVIERGNRYEPAGEDISMDLLERSSDRLVDFKLGKIDLGRRSKKISARFSREDYMILGNRSLDNSSRISTRRPVKFRRLLLKKAEMQDVF